MCDESHVVSIHKFDLSEVYDVVSVISNGAHSLRYGAGRLEIGPSGAKGSRRPNDSGVIGVERLTSDENLGSEKISVTNEIDCISTTSLWNWV